MADLSRVARQAGLVRFSQMLTVFMSVLVESHLHASFGKFVGTRRSGERRVRRVLRSCGLRGRPLRNGEVCPDVWAPFLPGVSAAKRPHP